MRTIMSGDLKTRLNASTEHAILDVRREGDFATGHLFWATNIPRSLLELKIERLVPRRSTPITLIAASETEAENAAKLLGKFGYLDVAILAGGLESWKREAGQLFSGINVPSKAFGEFVEQTANTPHIGPEALKDLLDGKANVVVFDARPFAEYQQMSIPGAINCPGGELVYRISDNLPSADAIVVVNCAGRTRSIMGAQSLIDVRVPNRVVALRDGTMGWHLAGYALEHGRTRRAPPPSRTNTDEMRAKATELAEKAGVRFLQSTEIGEIGAEIVQGDLTTTYIFDVRDPIEYIGGHRRDAVSAPGGQLLQTLDTFVAVQNARIVVTDSDGTRAPIIGAWLRQMGKNDVFCAVDTEGDSVAPPPPGPMVQAIVSRAKSIKASGAFANVNAKKAVIVDLANSKEYSRGHIANAEFRERHQISELLRVIPAGQSAILTSPDGQLAAVAAAELRSDDRVLALEGGTSAWADAGYAMQSGRGNLPKNPDDVFYRPYDRAEDSESAMKAYLDWEKDLFHRVAGEPGVSFWRLR